LLFCSCNYLTGCKFFKHYNLFIKTSTVPGLTGTGCSTFAGLRFY
jgi:hypothetical protein